ncbi:hypothetical protein L6164_031617 [Bauhinia variegata]|uniref:Uncharacterized protein n=1 Tax=Bauhinia variegata TaxID=167791 RepID=A0ACB9LGG7_BAUVA|nr:hypothetical protein L6164_031617 [Bauhinia variegata]
MDLKGLLIFGALISQLACLSYGKIVLEVHHKYNGRKLMSLKAQKAHDAQRHGRGLSDVDLGVGGHVYKHGLYWTKLTIGTPPKEYYLHVDTGSYNIWLNCIDCEMCPKEAFGFQNILYDPKASTTSQKLLCGQGPCVLEDKYADGSTMSGYFITDVLRFQEVTADFHTAPSDAKIEIGCARQEVPQGMKASIGILGLSQQPRSLISQLAQQGKTKRVFSHCLDSEKGGGIFTIGELVEPKVNTTPLVSKDKDHYKVYMTGIDVDGEPLDILSLKTGKGRETFMDTGATRSYFPPVIYKQLMKNLTNRQPALQLDPTIQDICIPKTLKNVDEEFPTFTFHFANSVPLTAHPHDYVYSENDKWCILLNSMDMDEPVIGDIFLSDKVVVYDLENQTVGWTNDEYNCASHNIKVKDDKTGTAFSVGARNIS